MLAVQHEIGVTTQELLVLLFRQNLSLMAELTQIVTGQEEVKLSVKHNVEKELREWVAEREAAKRARSQYTK